MSFLGIDYGEKKIGLAKSVHDRFAVPLKVLSNDNSDDRNAIEEIKRICREEDIQTIVVGIPIPLRGSKQLSDHISQQEARVRRFIHRLQASLKIPIVVEDERLTTRLAERYQQEYKNTGEVDASAAMLILQAYLEKHKKKNL